MKTSRNKSYVLIALIAVLNLGISSPTSASWISWGGVGSTLVGIGAAATPTGVGQVIGVVAGVGQVGCLLTDTYKTLFGSPPPLPQPSFASSPEPGELPLLASMNTANYQHLSIVGATPGETALIDSTNLYIDKLNIMTAAMASGGSESDYVSARAAMGAAHNQMSQAFDSLGFSLTLTQPQLNAMLSDILATGLPSSEVNFLNSAGWSSADITAVGNFVGSVAFNITGASVTAGQLFKENCCPEPNSLALTVLGLGVFPISAVRRRRCNKLTVQDYPSSLVNS
ncbi:hypothetical protein [Sulfurirhabdus autotrophica]|uniref:Putative secreted protein with PEP-CTERM sorting signal n=1 Tax=Sulfurirhabdus autotrophica TaxID=1706046 RepID=A0A4R3YDT2_9PROT|nr:hypothetical protein [Sulfurirhabdus autotrophica]TCV90665.1 putative secreted protein with PEP-CTERM sorting signal [Sulfurirhabdus autotrophica]